MSMIPLLAILSTFVSSAHALAAPASLVCHEQRTGDDQQALRVLEVKEGVATFVLFLSEPVPADASVLPASPCAEGQLCGRLYLRGRESGSFRYDFTSQKLEVSRPDTLFGPATVTRQPVQCAAGNH